MNVRKRQPIGDGMPHIIKGIQNFLRLGAQGALFARILDDQQRPIVVYEESGVDM